MSQSTAPSENPRKVYSDIIDLPHWEPSEKHPRMPLYNRAAQFAPFAALSGFDEMMERENRKTEKQTELSDEQKSLLDRKINRIDGVLLSGRRPTVSITYFIHDSYKPGGKYVTIKAQIKRVDAANRKLFLVTKDQPDLPDAIPFDLILDLEGELLSDLDD